MAAALRFGAAVSYADIARDPVVFAVVEAVNAARERVQAERALDAELAGMAAAGQAALSRMLGED